MVEDALNCDLDTDRDEQDPAYQFEVAFEEMP